MQLGCKSKQAWIILNIFLHRSYSRLVERWRNVCWCFRKLWVNIPVILFLTQLHGYLQPGGTCRFWKRAQWRERSTAQLKWFESLRDLNLKPSKNHLKLKPSKKQPLLSCNTFPCIRAFFVSIFSIHLGRAREPRGPDCEAIWTPPSLWAWRFPARCLGFRCPSAQG